MSREPNDNLILIWTVILLLIATYVIVSPTHPNPRPLPTTSEAK